MTFGVHFPEDRHHLVLVIVGRDRPVAGDDSLHRPEGIGLGVAVPEGVDGIEHLHLAQVEGWNELHGSVAELQVVAQHTLHELAHQAALQERGQAWVIDRLQLLGSVVIDTHHAAAEHALSHHEEQQVLKAGVEHRGLPDQLCRPLRELVGLSPSHHLSIAYVQIVVCPVVVHLEHLAACEILTHGSIRIGLAEDR